MSAGVSLYDPRRQRVLVSLGPGYESHYTDGHGRLLCSPMSTKGMQTVIGDAPSCGWCFLLVETERNTLAAE